MPDAIQIKDPFEKSSPKKEVTRIQWKENKMRIALPMLLNYAVVGYNAGNMSKTIIAENGFAIKPGVYLVCKPSDEFVAYSTHLRPKFYAPLSSGVEPIVVHQSLAEVSSGKPFSIAAKIIGGDSVNTILIEIRNSSNKWKTVPVQHISGYEYKVDVPADMVTPGLINYRILIGRVNGEHYTFPGGFKGNPYAWDEYRAESWQTFVAAPDSPLEIFNPTTDRSRIMLYNPDWRTNTVEYITADKPNQLVLKATMSKPNGTQFMGWQYYFSDKIAGRKDELSSFTKLVMRARASTNTQAKLSLITTKADAFAETVLLTSEWRDIEIPLIRLQKAGFLLLPRPYPGFLPLRFTSKSTGSLLLQEVERIEISFGEGAAGSGPLSIEVASVYLRN
jgi:hypothetical protein